MDRKKEAFKRLDQLNRLNELNRDLVAAFALLGDTCEQASKSFQTFGKAMPCLLKQLEQVTAWQRFSFDNKIKR